VSGDLGGYRDSTPLLSKEGQIYLVTLGQETGLVQKGIRYRTVLQPQYRVGIQLVPRTVRYSQST